MTLDETLLRKKRLDETLLRQDDVRLNAVRTN